MDGKLIGMGFVLVLGCGGAADSDGDTQTQGSTSGSMDTGSSEGMDTESGDSETGMEVDELELVRAQFVIPAGTTVQEFEFAAAGVSVPVDTTAGLLAVSILDLTHPDREQSELCMGDHPLNGCATVDYGAFGTTHDNRISVAEAGGAMATFHLYKDRTLEGTAEPLPPAE